MAYDKHENPDIVIIIYIIDNHMRPIMEDSISKY